MYTLADKSTFSEATVDNVTIVAGGKPVELTDDQIKRLKDAGVKLKEVDADGNEPTADADPTPPAGTASGSTERSGR